VGISAGPFMQARGADVRWTVGPTSADVGILIPFARSPNTFIRSHDPGMYQPTLFAPNPHPDYFTSVVVEASQFANVEFGLGSTS
jgi:hypothetical protein